MSAGLLGGALGAVAGFFIGGPQVAMYGYSIGSALGSYISPPKGPHLEGPRLGDLSVQTSTYGAVIPRGYGTFPVTGNVFWLENNALREVATTTTTSSGGKGGGGGSESTQTTYSYYATFAVGLCEGPIAGVRRIWIGADLIYDASANDVASLVASNAAAAGFTIHLGTDTQAADARMQATLGVANTPAYRGLAYIVFNDLALARYGNSLAGAQVRAEVVSASSIATTPRLLSAGSTYPQRGMTVTKNVNGVLVGIGTGKVSTDSYMDQAAIGPSGAVTIAKSMKFGISTVNFTSYAAPNSTALVVALTNSVGSELAWYNASGAEYGSRISMADAPIYAFIGSGPIAYHAASDSLLVLGQNSGSAIYCCSATPGKGYWNMATLRSSMPVAFAKLYGSYDGAVYAGVGTTLLYEIDNNFAVLDGPWTYPSGLQFLGRDGMYFYFQDTGSASDYKIVELEFDGSSYTLGNSKQVGTGGQFTYNGYLGGRLVWAYVGSAGVGPAGSKFFGFSPLPSGQTEGLGAIVSAEMLKSGLLAGGDIDTSALSQAVRGYRIASVAAIRSALEPLMGAWPFDVVQHGYQVKCVPRGGASIATVAAGDLDARSADQAPGVAVTTVREMDTVLPARVTLKFLDADREYNDNEQYAERLNTLAVNVLSLDMAIVLTATEAAQIAERLLYLYWLERYDVSLKLPPTYNQVEPSDVITVNADEGVYSLRLTKIHYAADGRLECQAKYHSAATYTPTAVGESGAAVSGIIALEGPAFLLPLDIPLLRDAADKAGFPVAMAGHSSAWSGGVLYQTTDGGQTWLAVRGFTGPGAVIGVASAAIGPGRTDLIDKSSALTVTLNSGTLSSVSESAMLNGANHFAYGAHGRWEIIAAQNCTLQGDGSYILTDLLRGRAGTEWACGIHGAYDSLVLLDSAALPFLNSSIDTIGTARTYRAVTVGQTLASVADQAFTYAGVNLECLSPVYLNGNRHPTSNDWSLDWIRRTRVGGEWRDYIDAPLSEASQSYEVDIFSSSSYVTLKRTLSGLTTPAATYTSAQQVADFGSNQATLYVKVYQLSANVGRGYPLTTSITR